MVNPEVTTGMAWCPVSNTGAVCVCVCILFHREGFFRLQDAWDILEGTDQRCCVVSIIRCAAAEFLHLGISKYHISPPKTKTPATYKLERKRCDIYALHEKMI